MIRIAPGIWASVILVFAVFVPSLFVLSWTIEDYLAPGALLYWLQVISGNWSPTFPLPVSKFWFAFSAVIAVLLNNALLIVVLSALWRLTSLWRTRMQLGQAIVTRDQMNKQALFAQLDPNDEDARKRINAAFVEGDRAWRENLYLLFGEKKASQILELLEKHI